MRILLLMTFAICVRVCCTAQYQSDTTASIVKIAPNKEYFKSYAYDIRDAFLTISRWREKEWTAAGCILGTSLVLWQFDDEIQKEVQKMRNIDGDNISKWALEPWGGIYAASLTACVYLHGIWQNNDRNKRVAMLGVKSFLLAGLIVRIPKALFARHRPNADASVNPRCWDFLSLEHASFASGHTTSSFALATIFALEYQDKKWVSILSYTMAGLVGLSRIYDNKHWATDVLVGAALGISVGRTIYRHNNWGISLMPVPSKTGLGVSLRIPIKK